MPVRVKVRRLKFLEAVGQAIDPFYIVGTNYHVSARPLDKVFIDNDKAAFAQDWREIGEDFRKAVSKFEDSHGQKKRA